MYAFQEVPQWPAAVRRATLIADFSAYQHIEVHETVRLLALLLYVRASREHIAVDDVDVEWLAARIREADQIARGPYDTRPEHRRTPQGSPARRQERLIELHNLLLDGVIDAGHPMPPEPGDEVGAAMMGLNVLPARNHESLSEYPAWMVHPQGSTALGRACGSAESILDEIMERREKPAVDRQTATVGDEPAPTRLTVLVPATDAVRDLAAIYQPTLHAWSHLLTQVALDCLHLSLTQVQLPLAEITDLQREQFAEAVRDRLTRLEPVVVEVGPALAAGGGVQLDMSPDSQVWELKHAAWQAVTAVFGPCGGEVGELSWRPRISLAHSYTTGSVEGLQDDLIRMRDRRGNRLPHHRPNRVSMAIDQVLICEQDSATTRSSWTRAVPVPITDITPHATPPAEPC